MGTDTERAESLKCDACGDWTPISELHDWQPPAAMRFACTKVAFHVCKWCLRDLPEVGVVSAYRTDSLCGSEGEAGYSYRSRRSDRPICGQRRWPGSHVACVCYADHEGPHESAEGDRWHTPETAP